MCVCVCVECVATNWPHCPVIALARASMGAVGALMGARLRQCTVVESATHALLGAESKQARSRFVCSATPRALQQHARLEPDSFNSILYFARRRVNSFYYHTVDAAAAAAAVGWPTLKLDRAHSCRHCKAVRHTQRRRRRRQRRQYS